MSAALPEALALGLGTIMAAALIGGVKWVRAVSSALSKLADVADKLTDVTGAVDTLRVRLAEHERRADVRWAQLGGAVHPRYLTANDRPAPAAIPEPR